MAGKRAGPPGRPAVVPRATYRLQFNSDFTFADATALVAYLDELGVSHCYASPWLKARAGSRHGYDIVDHSLINPEIGSSDDLAAFVAALKNHGMGQIVDIVPNHMAIHGADNAWWLDVLENGQVSEYADYFDINWQPLDPHLQGKVLLPLLGGQYGDVLTRGDIRLCFDLEAGAFHLAYFEHRLPIDPATYGLILRPAAAAGRIDVASRDELQALADACAELPSRVPGSTARVAERRRTKMAIQRRLAALANTAPGATDALRASVAAINGEGDDSRDALHALIKAQAYRLAHWRVATDEINYRRFFDVSDLAALRMEKPEAFVATHRLILALVARGDIDGLRIDHADGLFDPARYFRVLQSEASKVRNRAPDGRARAPLYVVIEKILADHEQLPHDWQIAGSTGYGFSNLVNGLFVDAAVERRMSRIYSAFTGVRESFDEIAYASRKLVIHALLQSELNMLAARLARLAASSRYSCDYTLNSLTDALAEVVACFPVYRTYIAREEVSADDRRHIEWATAVARKRSPLADPSVFDFINAVLCGDIDAGSSGVRRKRALEIATRFQQYTAPVMAKGVEDTAFYRYHRLISLNEVGADPRRFGVTPSAFHAAIRSRGERWPDALLAGSTHDSKRSEDVRARINVLSELPAAWKLALRRWRRFNRSKKRLVDGEAAPSANDEYLLYQTLFGSWPLCPGGEELSDGALADYRRRIVDYMQKALREAKQKTSWIKVNVEYESAVAAFVEALLTRSTGNLFLADFAPATRRLARYGLVNALAQTLLRLTAPGVPDIYQGCETWQFALVDPDNRRAIDYDERRRQLAELRALQAAPVGERAAACAALAANIEDGRAKLWVVWRALQLRRRWSEIFTQGSYVPWSTRGRHCEHVVAFSRHHGDRSVLVIVPRLLARLRAGAADDGALDWADTSISSEAAAPATWFNVLSGEEIAAGPGGAIAVGKALASFPVALLAHGAGWQSDAKD